MKVKREGLERENQNIDRRLMEKEKERNGLGILNHNEFPTRG